MNTELFYLLNNFAEQNFLVDKLFVFLGDYMAYVLVLAAIVFLFLLKDKKEKLNFFIISLVSVFLARGVIVEVIRYFYHHPRPFTALGGIHQLIFNETSYSFPSGHAAVFFALAMAICFFNKKWGVVFFTAATLMGVARVISGVHWPLDILGGAIIGILSVWLVKIALEKKG